MRGCCWVLLIGCGASGDTSGVPPAPVDPADPLIGSWSIVDSDGAPTFLDWRWTFGADGTYAYEGTQKDSHAGTWQRLDDDNIELCATDCVVPTPIVAWLEEPYVIVDPSVAVNGSWSLQSPWSCYAHGREYTGTRSLSLRSDGSAEYKEACSGLGPVGMWCQGTWTTKPVGVHVTFDSGGCSESDYFRLSDAIGVGFRRVE